MEAATSATELGRRAKAAAFEVGFDLVGYSPPTLLPAVEEALDRWVKQGYAGDMEYMTHEPHRRTRPADRWPDLKTVMCLGLNYYSPRPAPPPASRLGRVSTYAYGRDYHRVIEKKLKALSRRLPQILGEDAVIKSYVDTGPVLERAFAAQAGLGFIGKSTNLISQLYGSWIFLAVLLLRTELEPDSPSKVSCGSCTRCLEACPTGAFPAPYVLDATRCLTYHTVESQKPVPADLAARFGDWVFGCDICQEVCPFTKFSNTTTVEDFLPPHPPSEIHPSPSKAGAWLDLDEIARIPTDEEFQARFQGTPIMRAKRSGLRRFSSQEEPGT